MSSVYSDLTVVSVKRKFDQPINGESRVDRQTFRDRSFRRMCKPKIVASVASNSVSGSCDVAGSQKKTIAMRKEKELMEASNSSTRNNRICQMQQLNISQSNTHRTTNESASASRMNIIVIASFKRL